MQNGERHCGNGKETVTRCCCGKLQSCLVMADRKKMYRNDRRFSKTRSLLLVKEFKEKRLFAKRRERYQSMVPFESVKAMQNCNRYAIYCFSNLRFNDTGDIIA